MPLSSLQEMNKMKQTKTEFKLLQMTTNHYGNPLVTSSQAYVSPRNSFGSTFQRETSSKPLHEADDYHIFATEPNLVSPNQSFDERDSAMNISISSSGSWSMPTEKEQPWFSLIGLPSEYPSHKKSPTSVTSSTFPDEFDGIDEFFDDVLCLKSIPSSSSTIDEHPLKSDSGSSLKTSSRPKPGHRRSRARIDSTDSYKELIVSSSQKRRQRHNALCAKDFHEKILKELYQDL
jgi:hypothetical protein